MDRKDKGKILITSAGFNTVNNYVSEDNIKLFTEISKGKKVLIVANAAPEGSGNFVARENVKENFLNAGATEAEIIDLVPADTEIILNYDVLYFLGGDVGRLANLLNESNLADNLHKFLEDGGVYIGESAGSIILSDDVKYIYDIKKGTKPKYDVQLPSYRGFGLTKLKIFPHTQKTNEEIRARIDAYEANTGEKITRINDGDIIIEQYDKIIVNDQLAKYNIYG